MPIDSNLVTSVLANWQTPQMPDMLQQYAKIQALKNGIIQQQLSQQQLQNEQLNYQQQQQQIDANTALNNAIRNNMTAGPNGAPVVDHAGVVNALASTGHGNLIAKYQEGVALQAKNNADAQKVQLENASTMIDRAAREFGNATSQDDWNIALAHLRGMGGDPAQMGIPALYSPDAQSRVQNLAIATKDKIDNELKAREATTKEAAETREQQAQKDKEADAALQALAGANADNFADLRADAMAKLQAAGRAPSMVPGAWSKEGQAALNESLLTADQRRQEAQAEATLTETKRYHDAELDNSAKRLGIEQQRLWQDQEQTKLSPEALDKMAEMFATTGQLPTMGMGRAAALARSQVINRAAELYPNVQFATNRAAFDANRQSLKQAQTRMDQVDAAEQTAGKNLDVFLNTAKQVIDTGSPWINKPLRDVAGQGLGSADMEAFNAARQTAIQEIAKVLNNPQGGAAPSDAARKEVETLIGPNATLKQIYSAANILRTDMKNRHDAYQGQINAITQRIGSATGGGAQTAAPQPTATPLPADWLAKAKAAKNGETVVIPDGRGGSQKALKTGPDAWTPLQ